MTTANDASELLNETTASGYSVRSECWHAIAIALAEQWSAANWIEWQEHKAVRRGKHELAPWLPCGEFHERSVAMHAR